MSEQKRMHLNNLEELMAVQSDLTLQIEIAFGEGLVAANAIKKTEETDNQ
ncbi:MAG: hypothetical protein K2L86_13190 [Lachnospiraceae bacterium]|nr:hypothetical protein [Lachnospiraceae bacterium]